MPKFRNTETGRTVNATGKLARRYERLKSYEVVGPAPVDQHADADAKASEEYANRAAKRTKS